MAIRGRTVNIGINPIPNKEAENIENFVPSQVEIRNGQVSQTGNWIKRPGFSENWDVGIDKPVDLLIPRDTTGYGIAESGEIYKLNATPTQLAVDLAGTSRPKWDHHNDLIIIVDGGTPIAIDAGVSRLLLGSPPNAKYISRHGPYTLMSGHDPTEFKWCASGNPENWTTGDSGFANVQKAGGIIRNQLTRRDVTHFFTDNHIELWTNLGGATPFVNMQGAVIEKGTKAGDSAVLANDQIYFFGNDGDFYALQGLGLKIISSLYRRELDKLINPNEMYGFDFRKENIVRWFAPTDGKCFVWDYQREIFSEDNSWFEGQWQRLPVNSYMELNNKQYFGSFNLDGLIHEWSHDHKDDNGDPIRVIRNMRFAPSQRGRRVKFNRLGFRFQRGFDASHVVMYRVKLDEADWGPLKTLDMGALGDRNPYIAVFGLGVGREIEVEVSHTAASNFVLTNLDCTFKELGK